MDLIRQFEWDPLKAATNRRKHGIDFDEAMTVFADRLTVSVPDTEHSEEEDRWVTIGRSSRHRPIVVVYTERGDCIRIISARKPSSQERKSYEQRIQEYRSQA